MFSGTVQKLEDARILCQQLANAGDSITFRAIFSSFLNSARAITYALQKEGARKEGFAEWYALKQKEMKADKLLRFIHEARTEDFHEGKHRLSFATYVNYFSTSDASSRPSLDAYAEMGPTGIFWVVNGGTPKEKRIPVDNASYEVHVSIDNPPIEHLGRILTSTSPIHLCELAVAYFELLVFEAKTQFESSS